MNKSYFIAIALLSFINIKTTDTRKPVKEDKTSPDTRSHFSNNDLYYPYPGSAPASPIANDDSGRAESPFYGHFPSGMHGAR